MREAKLTEANRLPLDHLQQKRLQLLRDASQIKSRSDRRKLELGRLTTRSYLVQEQLNELFNSAKPLITCFMKGIELLHNQVSLCPYMLSTNADNVFCRPAVLMEAELH